MPSQHRPFLPLRYGRICRGGLLGDTLSHLLPEIFLGEAEPAHARFVLIEPNKIFSLA